MSDHDVPRTPSGESRSRPTVRAIRRPWASFDASSNTSTLTVAVALGSIRGDVGVRQELVDRNRVFTLRVGSDARTDEHFVAVHVVRLAERGQDAIGERRRMSKRLHVATDDEFVAAEPNAHVAVAQRVAEPAPRPAPATRRPPRARACR